MRVAARAVEERFNADTTDHSGPALSCTCGKMAHFSGRHPKTFESVIGALTLLRAYYHCDSCGAGFCPRDQRLGLFGSSLSPGVLRMVGHVGALVSFHEGHDLLHDLAGVNVPTKQVERAAEALGREIASDEKNIFESPPPEQALPPTLYLGMDGTGIPMRKAELQGRAGKQEDGSSKTREVKLVTIWSAEGRDEDGVPVRDEGSVSYSAAIESAASNDLSRTPSEFAQRVVREATRRGFEKAERHAVLGDGAPWIWNLATEHFPNALQIVDRFHVNEHLSKVAKAIYGSTSDLGKQWTHERCKELKSGDIDNVLGAIAIHASQEEARKCIEYIKTNRDRMQYGEFHAAGLCTSTGVVESGCKRVIGVRLKRGGMFWTVPGANNIVALRSCRLSGRFEDFWERRSSKAVA